MQVKVQLLLIGNQNVYGGTRQTLANKPYPDHVIYEELHNQMKRGGGGLYPIIYKEDSIKEVFRAANPYPIFGFIYTGYAAIILKLLLIGNKYIIERIFIENTLKRYTLTYKRFTRYISALVTPAIPTNPIPFPGFRATPPNT
ncbi:Pc22g10380 [Penicillium rubens Wisconsin 54-1255]|uniref:Pc22g10380 protein n=1 Tax=Penicillium rubens (strain ATCC 28089 / DSM 1075 / NRRL 1951 / Wisconsin 54-1255) TaxID=500485 RepID=B6HVL2_PENRW|nr:Pc22g10380 [Penicillium rubens Wisconsin 54-1255]